MEYVPCIGNSSYSFWWILLKLYRCFKDGLEICIMFFSESWNYFLSLFSHFYLRHFSSPYTTDMYMEYIPCIGNSSYSFWRILLKLYSCFQDGLKICILFSQDPEIIFFLHFNLDIFSSLYATDMYREYMPCIGNPAYSFRPILLKLYRYFAAFLWFHMRNLSLAGYNCSGGASCMACSFIDAMLYWTNGMSG